MQNRVVNVPGSDPVVDAGLDLDDLTIDPQDFGDTSFDNCDVVVRDIYTQAGGPGQGTAQDGTKFDTQDQIVILCDVIDAEFPEGGSLRIYLPLPKLGPDGKRRTPQKNSKYGLFFELLTSLGVSSQPEMAFVMHISSVYDLIGLKFHRLRESTDMGSFTMRAEKPTEILGFDHELRASASTPQRTLNPVDFVPPQAA